MLHDQVVRPRWREALRIAGEAAAVGCGERDDWRDLEPSLI